MCWIILAFEVNSGFDCVWGTARGLLELQGDRLGSPLWLFCVLLCNCCFVFSSVPDRPSAELQLQMFSQAGV